MENRQSSHCVDVMIDNKHTQTNQTEKPITHFKFLKVDSFIDPVHLTGHKWFKQTRGEPETYITSADFGSSLVCITVVCCYTPHPRSQEKNKPRNK